MPLYDARVMHVPFRGSPFQGATLRVPGPFGVEFGIILKLASLV
jgi:hypothetical protein